MKIAILLLKENFSPDAVSLFVNETSINSKFKKDITVFEILFKKNLILNTKI